MMTLKEIKSKLKCMDMKFTKDSINRIDRIDYKGKVFVVNRHQNKWNVDQRIDEDRYSYRTHSVSVTTIPEVLAAIKEMSDE